MSPKFGDEAKRDQQLSLKKQIFGTAPETKASPVKRETKAPHNYQSKGLMISIPDDMQAFIDKLKMEKRQRMGFQ